MGRRRREGEREQRIEASLMIMIIMIEKELIMKMNIGKNEMIKSAYHIYICTIYDNKKYSYIAYRCSITKHGGRLKLSVLDCLIPITELSLFAYLNYY